MFLTILLGIFFTIFSCCIMAYISMATMVGPWIAPLIILMSNLILRLKLRFNLNNNNNNNFTYQLALIQTMGSVGGIIGTAIGFSLPTLYFLDKNYFNFLLNNKLYFYSGISLLTLGSGGLGIFFARFLAKSFLKKEELKFPVSQLVYDTIKSQGKEKLSQQMFFGLISSWVVCFFRDGFLKFKGFIPKNFSVISISPILWAIGFTTGVSIIAPLIIGVILKYLLLLIYSKTIYFNNNIYESFVAAFSCGLILSDVGPDLFKYFIKLVTKKFKNPFTLSDIYKIFNPKKLKPEFIFTFIILLIIFSFLKFNILEIITLLILLIISIYQISYLAGKLGLVTFGRFATFIMLPMLFLFNLNFFQTTIICVFFNICAGLVCNLLFNYKIGQLCNISFKAIYIYQWLGLIVTSIASGFIFYLLFTHFQLGSADLFAQRGLSRALLIKTLNFDFKTIFIGLFTGLLLKKFKLNSTMILGGILMPNNLTVGLLIGAISSYFLKKNKDDNALWAGVFAGESLWILIKILSK